MRESRRKGGQRGRGGVNRVYRLVGHSKDSVPCSEVDIEPLEGLDII